MRQEVSSSGGPPGRRSVHEIRAVLAAHARSGLSLLAFAHAEDLGYATLRRWRQLYGEGRAHPGDRATPRRRPSSPGFVPVEVEPAGSGGEFVLAWPGGRSLRIPVGFDADHLRRVLAVLEERS